MPMFCTVIGCGSRSGRDSISFFRFSSTNKRHDVRKTVDPLCLEQWISALRRANMTESKLQSQRVFAKYFISSKKDIGVWWPLIVIVFYVFAPIPTLLARRYTEVTGSTNSSMDLAIFTTMAFVVSSFALPIVLARAEVIAVGACYLTLAGNVVVYFTFIGFFVTLYQDDSEYSMW